jgi:mercuric ion binding protein
MKKIILITVVLLGAVLSLNAQSCCDSSSSKKESSCSSEKKTKKDRKNKKSKASLNQEKSETFMVYGNCGMCENTIEKTANSVDGVTSADWDKETDLIQVIFDDEVTSFTEINQAIADSGYDTATHRATDSVYNNLPGCCQYERPNRKK